MKRFLITNSKIFTILFFVLFYLSCNNESPTEVTSEIISYTLEMTHYIEGGEIDYADNNGDEETVIRVTLTQQDLDGNSSVVANKSVKFDWTIVEEPQGENQPYLKTFDDVTILKNGTTQTNGNGEIWLYWYDEGQIGEVTVDAQFIDDDGNPSDADPISFTIHSVYEKVSSIEPINYIIAEIEYDVENNNTKTGQIGARVKDNNGIKIQGVDVNIIQAETLTSIPDTDPIYSDFYPNITLGESNESTDNTGKAYFTFELEVDQNLIDAIAANNDAIDLYFDIYVEDSSLINSSTDYNNNGIPDYKDEVTLTLTTEAFSIAGSLESMSIDVSEDSFILDTNDDTQYSIEIYTEALTSGGGILIPPEGQTIDFRFSRDSDNDCGSLSQSEYASDDGTATIALTGISSDCLENSENHTILINSWIVENGEQLTVPVSESVFIQSQEALLIANIHTFSLEANPNFILAASEDTTYTINLTASVKDSLGIGIEDINVSFQNTTISSDSIFTPIGNLGSSGIATTNSSGLATMTLSEVSLYEFLSLGLNPIDNQITISASINGYDESANTAIAITNEELESYVLIESGTLEISLEPSLYLINDIPTSDDSSESSDTTSTEGSDQTNNDNQIQVNAIAKDAFGAGIQGLPIFFDNINPELATLSFYSLSSNESGIAENSLNNINIPDNSLDTISVEISVLNPYSFDNNEIIATTASAIIGKQSEYNIANVTNLDAVFLQNFSLINNINIQYEDSLVAQVLDANNVPVADVPISFSLETNDIGYINDNIAWSDSDGMAGTKFVITAADMQQDIDSVTINLNIFVTEELQETITRTYIIEGSANVEEDVDQFHYWPSNPDMIEIFTPPDQSASIQMPFIAKDDEGVRIEGVPVQFEIFWSSNRSNGSLNTSLSTTCCSSDSTMVDSLFDWNNDGISTTNENMGIASVLYANSLPGTSDSIRAFITNPENQSQYLFEEKILISTLPTEAEVSSLFSYAVPQTIHIDNVDSVYCDTIFTIARNSSGQSLQNIPIDFLLDADDFNYGSITNNYDITDTIATLPFFGAKTVFCTWPNIAIDQDTVVVNIQTSVPESEIDPFPIEIFLIENLPECPDCEASLNLEAEYYELPAGDNDIFTSLITATVIDSTENPVPPFTLVEFQSLTQDENGDWVQIGDIEPYKYTDENGSASATFNMSNDVGLASIIGTCPEYNLADTIYLSLYSTSASSIEIVQPFPNEIMVQGGGGIESTEIDVNIKDGNGNLVSEPFLVFFELLNSAPNGVYLNEHDDNDFIECAESSNGVATVTLNAGTQPGSVPINVELYDLDLPVACDNIDANTFSTYGITSAGAIPVTVVTGPPAFGQINYSYIDITPIGGGLYEVPLSVHLWDFYSNPVSDSTNVYIWIEGIGAPWSADSTYTQNDTIKWGGFIDENGDGIYDLGVDDPYLIDSLLYVWSSLFESSFLSNPDPGDDLELSGIPVWTPIAHPGAVEGEAKTGMLAPDNQSYPGVAWSNVHYGTSDIFANTVIKALTYDSDGEKLIVDSRESHNDQPLVLPFQPGSLAGTSSIQFWDFSVFGDQGLNDLDDTVAVTITANLTDYYQYPVDDGTILLSAPGANVWSVCNPADTDGDGYVGECWEDTNGSGALEIPPTFGPDTINEDLGLTCSICISNGGFWNFDDSNDGDGSIPDGDGIIDDDPLFGKTNGDGQIVWNISYSEALNAGDGNNPETYSDFTSTVILQLLDPLQTSSDGVDILLIKSENNENP